MDVCDSCENNVSTAVIDGFGDVRRSTAASAASASAEAGKAEADGDGDGSKWSPEELLVVMVYLSVLSVVGTAGNGLVLYVYAKKKDRLVSTLFILVLAVVDFTTCLVVIPYTIYMEYTDFHVDIDVVCKLYLFLITSNIPFSALIMVAIAVDRYFCICHPFLHVMTIARAKVTIATLAIFATGLGICVSLTYGVYAGGASNESTIATLLLDSRGSSSSGGNSWAASVTPVSQMDRATSEGVTLNYDYGGDSERLSIDGPSSSSSSAVRRNTCEANDVIISHTFQWYFQKLYTSLFPLCLAVVVVLYALIYRRVLYRRSRRQKQKSRSLGLVQSLTSAVRRRGRHRQTSTTDDILDLPQPDALSELNSFVNTADPCAAVGTASLSPSAAAGGGAAGKRRGTVAEGGVADGKIGLLQANGRSRRSSKADTTFLANMKTAAMLFVVTAVFVVTYLPAFLMALELIPYNIIVFYMYFANNFANPVIYSFMNQNFRVDLRKIFCHRH